MSLKFYRIISVILASFCLGFFIYDIAYTGSFSFPLLVGSCTFMATMFVNDLDRMKSLYKSFIISTIFILIAIYFI